MQAEEDADPSPFPTGAVGATSVARVSAVASMERLYKLVVTGKKVNGPTFLRAPKARPDERNAQSRPQREKFSVSRFVAGERQPERFMASHEETDDRPRPLTTFVVAAAEQV